RDVHVQFFEFVQIIQILRNDQRNLNVVDAHLLLPNQIEQKIQRPLIHRNPNLVPAGSLSGLVGQRFFTLVGAAFWLPRPGRGGGPLRAWWSVSASRGGLLRGAVLQS